MASNSSNIPRDIILYHKVVCSSSQNLDSGIYRGFDKSVFPQEASLGKDLIKTGLMTRIPGFKRIFSSFESFRNEALFYGVRLGLILVDPFGLESSSMTTIDGTTASAINQYDACLADTTGKSIAEDFAPRVQRLKYCQDVIVSVGSHPDSDFSQLKFHDMVRELNIGVIYRNAFLQNENSKFFNTLESKINSSSGKVWLGSHPDITAKYLINKNVKLFASYETWANASAEGTIPIREAPLFSMQDIISTQPTEIWNKTRYALSSAQTMDISLDLSKLTNNQRLILWSMAQSHHKNRTKSYR